MPRGRGRPPKPFIPGLLGGVVGGVMGGVGWHFATIYADPPQWVIYIVEALIGVVVALLLLTVPHSPQTPNLNPIIQLINAQ